MNHSVPPTATGEVVRTLKDGYWDRTEVIATAAGERRVRKRTKGAGFGPWGIASLRREIAFLLSLPADAARVFPPVLAAWDVETPDGPEVGYAMPFYADHLDAGELARRGSLEQNEIDIFQDTLAAAVVDCLHEPVTAEESLAGHVSAVIEEAWRGLENDPASLPLIQAPSLLLNGEEVAGPKTAFARIRHKTDALATLEAAPCVRLHGDFFLENILWRPAAVASTVPAPRLLLIDPVSVAGVSRGPPVFDLVKYVSYATGELLALRSERVFVEERGTAARREYVYRICWEDPALQPFRARDWHRRFAQRFEARHGPVDRRLYELLDGYFSVAMAVNTHGTQRRARLLKATAAFHAVLK